MELKTQKFSVEELAYILATTEQGQFARGLMAAHFAEENLTDDQLEQRWLAAAHSLMARELMAVGGDGQIYLDEDFIRLSTVLVSAEYTLRFSTTIPQGELNLGFHRAYNSWFEHRVAQGVVHQFVEFSDTERLVREGLRFLEPPQAEWTLPELELPGSFFEIMRAQDGSELQQLRDAGVPSDIALMLVEDVNGLQYQGNVMLIEYRENHEPISDYGFLLLQGPERLWILQPVERDGDTVLIVQPGSARTIETEVRALLRIKE